ncbi:phosphoglycerate mutase family protein [Dysgonomonas sp. 521]|uniref:phosphoglycerate mutase family protein n=1 Tax=Dysgonomonas sp. 521 TaxID=2302932 RepID=UPI0013D8C8E5|nr:phosphoglycerate mutase family protein [Dysgonomonas sp. 521]NDV96959.1 phosphoglycerate mutase family protein [Dysgonomonas sp. 521]
MDNILRIAERNQKRAWEIVDDIDIISIWQSIGAEINLVGSLKTGLLMTHRDIDFHIYSAPLDIGDSFRAITKLATNPSVKRIEYANLIDTDEKCIEWHAWYLDKENELWQIDMIHILKGSFYDGYFERVAERIIEVLTPEMRQTILRLKYETPDTDKIMGIEYYKAVINDGVSSYKELTEWKKRNTGAYIIDWIP